MSQRLEKHKSRRDRCPHLPSGARLRKQLSSPVRLSLSKHPYHHHKSSSTDTNPLLLHDSLRLRMSPPLSCSPMFSRRTDWKLTPNRFTEAQRELRAAGRKVLDLTVS